MTHHELLDIKEELRRFYDATEPLFQAWADNEKLTMIQVILQNLQFNGVGTTDYSETNAIEQFLKLRLALLSIKRYEDHHTINYVCNTVELIYVGTIMSNGCIDNGIDYMNHLDYEHETE